MYYLSQSSTNTCALMERQTKTLSNEPNEPVHKPTSCDKERVNILEAERRGSGENGKRTKEGKVKRERGNVVRDGAETIDKLQKASTSTSMLLLYIDLHPWTLSVSSPFFPYILTVSWHSGRSSAFRHPCPPLLSPPSPSITAGDTVFMTMTVFCHF